MRPRTAVRNTFFLKMWEQHPRTWKFLIDVGILLKYKTWNSKNIPDHITLSSSHTLYVNKDENRGRALLISDGTTQKRLTNFWGKAVKEFAPDLVIDVGLNYGECLFSTTYPQHTVIYGIEANADLIPYIHESRKVHPNQEQMKIINAFVSQQDYESVMFYKDKHWSGTSSATYMPAHNMIEKVPVKSITIDSLVHSDAASPKLLFKVDVEGYEPFVLKGMTNLLDRCSSAIGFIEFNSEYVEKLGIDLDHFLDSLKSYFCIYIFLEDEVIIKGNDLTYKDIQKTFQSEYIHTDFILVNKDFEIGLSEFIFKN
ncbi:FkbM family methyltransferase [Bacillus dakarensis]|uniref:FkbM family methyltransferase n=1 Tax=Robertmurraya dakarensis TaxID=1926278 RepID=UPI000981D1B6|nr:FkbM family methyltransferase [Bacillus dakarensis]